MNKFCKEIEELLQLQTRSLEVKQSFDLACIAAAPNFAREILLLHSKLDKFEKALVAIAEEKTCENSYGIVVPSKMVSKAKEALNGDA